MTDTEPRPSTPPTPLWRQAAIGICAFVAFLYAIEAVDTVSADNLDQAGIEPRTADGLWGIVFAPVLHDGWGHLLANTVPILVLGFLVLLSGIGRGLAATAIIWLVGGVGTWLTGGSGSLHIGASILVFGWLTYLLCRGVFTRQTGQIVLGAVVLILYGGLLWGALPGQPGVSWQGHLFGAIGGVLAAWVFAGDARRRRRENALTAPPVP